MSFMLNDVVPWGRNFSEYVNMFNLTESDLSKKIAGFGDGPASFNYEATEKGYDVVSFDPVYQFSEEELSKRIEEVRIIVMQQMKENMDNYVWENIQNLNELENLRMSAMRLFLSDYECGKAEKRYIVHTLPERLPYNDDTFDIGLSSHFLMMYTSLGYDFHIKAISEMLRVCREVRIFPIVDLDANKTSLINDVLSYFNNHYTTEIVTTNYEFQKGENKLLIITK
ncbi:MAG: class I SAM-dependent methyltransferase [Ruminococcus sp.]|nr:class I SAM-dependent methyltransferase [Ruminococcus sp.]